jgi:hypothetical protein
MLGRLYKSSKSKSSPSSPFPLPGQGGPPPFPPNPLASPNRGGRKLDITFNQRYLMPPPQPTVMSTIWRVKTRKKIEKAAIRRLPLEERRQFYLESRPMKQKLLDWVGNKVRALTRTMGTVDAWAGPIPKNDRYARLGMKEVKLLESGNVASLRVGLSERAKRVTTLGVIVSMGGLMGWLIFGLTQNTKAEGPILTTEPETKKKKKISTEEQDHRPGVFVWGSNRYFFTEFPNF